MWQRGTLRHATEMFRVVQKLVKANRRAADVASNKWPKLFKTESYARLFDERIRRALADASSVLEVGGIDRPYLKKEQGYEYVGMDIEERPRCHDVYDRFLVQSVEDSFPGEFDVILSVTLMEHVPNNSRAIASMFKALRPGGTTHHYVPSKNHPYSLGLRLIGPKLQKQLIPVIRPAAEAVTGYPAFFDRCTPAQMEAEFKRAGFCDVEVQPFYRANDYFAFLLPAYVAVTCLEKSFEALSLAPLASGFVISARKPEKNS